jgi:hypothetical protein
VLAIHISHAKVEVKSKCGEVKVHEYVLVVSSIHRSSSDWLLCRLVDFGICVDVELLLVGFESSSSSSSGGGCGCMNESAFLRIWGSIHPIIWFWAAAVMMRCEMEAAAGLLLS